MAGETQELLQYFPELSEHVTPVCDAMEKIAVDAYEVFMRYRGLATRKDFALAVKDTPWASILFKMLSVSDPTVEAAKAIMRNDLSLSAMENMLEKVR